MTLEKRHHIELFLLSALVLVMPSLEALKTFFWFSYLCFFLYNRFKKKNLSLLPGSPIGIAITLYLASTLASTLINWPIETGFKGFFDEVRFLTLFLCLYSAGYSATEYRRIAILIVVGVLGGLLYGLVEFLLGMSTDFQFHSAGILTQSSIYLGISIVLNTGLLLDAGNDTPGIRLFLKIALLLQIIALVYIGSRGSMLAVSLVFVFIAFLKLNIGTLIGWFSAFTVAILTVVALIQIFPQNIFSRDILNQYSIERIQASDNQRIGAWKIAMAKLSEGKDLVWGIGPRNYKAINEMAFVQQSERLSQIKKYNHAHNLFLTRLIEQGIAGLLTMLLFFGLILQKIISIWRAQINHRYAWAWYGGTGGLIVPLVAGLFNTPFYQEHAMLAMVVTGMMFANQAQSSLLKTPHA